MATIQQITTDPRFQKATAEQRQRLIARADDAPQSFKDKIFPIAGKAVSEATFQPGSFSSDMMHDPVTQAKALPALAGTVATGIPFPLAPAIATMGARKLSNAALDAYGRSEEKPSSFDQGLEGALSLLGSAGVIAPIKSKMAGKAIGAAENAFGITQDSIRRLPPPSQIRSAVVMLNRLKDRLVAGDITPLAAREIKPALDTIASKGWLKGTEYLSDFGHVSKRITALVNEIPGRGEAAAQMKSAEFIPNLAKKTWKAIPNPIRRGFGYAVGGGLGIESLRDVLGENK
jgi:hypothetical protein